VTTAGSKLLDMDGWEMHDPTTMTGRGEAGRPLRVSPAPSAASDVVKGESLTFLKDFLLSRGE